jgi:hypothetical protein
MPVTIPRGKSYLFLLGVYARIDEIGSLRFTIEIYLHFLVLQIDKVKFWFWEDVWAIKTWVYFSSNFKVTKSNNIVLDGTNSFTSLENYKDLLVKSPLDIVPTIRSPAYKFVNWI